MPFVLTSSAEALPALAALCSSNRLRGVLPGRVAVYSADDRNRWLA